MSDDPKKTVRNLQKEVSVDLDRLFLDITTQLRVATPKQTGKASRGWQKISTVDIEKDSKKTIIQNKVPYIDRLNDGHSRQAQAGFIEDTIKKTTDRHKKSGQ